MSWKFRLSLIAALFLSAVFWVKLPSQAGIDAESATNKNKVSFQKSKVTEYKNGVLKIQPQNFAVSNAVRDMPPPDKNSPANRVNFADREKLREKRDAKTSNETGISAQKEEDREINELNAERLRKSTSPRAGSGDGAFEDPLLKKVPSLLSPESPATMPTPSLTFKGASAADNASQGIDSLVPPDVNGDVGPNHYVSSVNLVLKMFNKSGAVVAGPIRTSALFASLPANDICRLSDSGDPIVVYDTLADRWHISQFGSADAGGNVNYQCVALSKTGDPTGEYYVWSYAYPLAAFNDYPKVGVWTDAYHMTFNQFNLTGSAQLGLGILSQDRSRALVGDPNAGAVYTNIGDFDQLSGGALPGDIDGYVAPPIGLAEVIGEYRSRDNGDPVDGVRMYRWAPNFTDPVNSTLTVLGDVRLAQFDGRAPNSRQQIEQMGGTNLDAVSDRSMHRFAYRNFGTTANPVNSYVGNFSVNVSGVNPTTVTTYQTGIRWFEMRRVNDSFSVFDQGTHNLTPGNGAGGLNDWMASIAQDNTGNIAVGFSQAGTTQKADIKIAGRTNNVQNSGILNEGEALMYAATGSQIAGSSRQPGNRWGDYSAMNVDPTDDCTFWYTQEYYEVTSSSDWSTRVGKFRYPQCTDAPKGIVQGTVTNCSTGAVINGAAINATGGFNRLTGAGGAFSLVAAPAGYNLTASKFGFAAGNPQTVTVAAGQTQTTNFCLVPVAVFSASGAPQISSESCGLPNGAPDPGEQITVSLPLQNNGAAATSNLTATLQTGGGLINSGAAQNFGAIAAGGSVSRNFTFTVDPNLACGSVVTLTFNLNDGATAYGSVTKTYTTGVKIQSLGENFDGVSPGTLPAGWTNVRLFGSSITWTANSAVSNSAPNAAFANDPTTKSTSALVSPAVQIQIDDAQLLFKNFYNTESIYDGTVLEFSTDDGTTWTDILAGGGSFESGRYNSFISAVTNSTLAGRLAWTGNSGSFVDTIVNLPPNLKGQTVRFRWVMASDAAVSGVAVGIDDVQVLGVRQCNTCSRVPVSCQGRSRNNFDADNQSDIAVYRPENGVWYFLNSQAGFSAVQFGISTDKIVPADYDGDGRTDIAVYRAGTWFLQRSSAGFASVPFGLADDIPVPADYDGDCKAEIAVYRPSNGTWYVLNLATGGVSAIQFGISTDKPVAADYDGDGRADYAVYRAASGTWYVQQSSQGFASVPFGISTDKPVVADYDGDGRADYAVYRPENGVWYQLRSRDGFAAVQFGNNTDLPVPSDYDGDGKADVAVYRAAASTWYQMRSTQGFAAVQFGIPTDKPIPNAYIP